MGLRPAAPSRLAQMRFSWQGQRGAGTCPGWLTHAGRRARAAAEVSRGAEVTGRQSGWERTVHIRKFPTTESALSSSRDSSDNEDTIVVVQDEGKGEEVEAEKRVRETSRIPIAWGRRSGTGLEAVVTLMRAGRVEVSEGRRQENQWE